MRKDIAGPEAESTMPLWQGLEGVVREKAHEFIQEILEEEVTELLGREKSERKAAVDAAPGYRNGYGKARRLSMSSGTITVRRPRVRGLEERFESRVLPLFARRTKELGATAVSASMVRSALLTTRREFAPSRSSSSSTTRWASSSPTSRPTVPWSRTTRGDRPSSGARIGARAARLDGAPGGVDRARLPPQRRVHPHPALGPPSDPPPHGAPVRPGHVGAKAGRRGDG